MIILIIILVAFAGIFARMGRREIQEKYCPYCSCREECSIGYKVSGVNSGTKPMACLNRVEGNHHGKV